jgi:hypothetical protein
MGKKLTVCLIGPQKGGKSSILATVTDCIKLRVHGYPSTMRPSLQPTTHGEFDDTSGSGGRMKILGVRSGSYEKLRKEFAEGVGATDAVDTYEYFFRLELNGRLPGVNPDNLPIAIQVVDAAGEIAIPQGVGDVSDEVRNKFDAQILNADALIFVVPLVNLENTEWIQLMSELIDRLALNPTKKVKRLVVAFTQYERMFVRLGPSAFTYACDPRIALYVLKNTLVATPWLDGLRSLESSANGTVDVRFTVTSAYGFAKTFHNPNIDPHQEGGEKRFRRDGLPIGRALNEFWRPFLTAEPLLYAALGQDSAFTFAYWQIDGAEAPPIDVEKTSPGADLPTLKRRKPTIWEKMRDALDVNR